LEAEVGCSTTMRKNKNSATMRYVASPLSDSSFEPKDEVLASFRSDSRFCTFMRNTAQFNSRFPSSPSTSASGSLFMVGLKGFELQCLSIELFQQSHDRLFFKTSRVQSAIS
jgi:hypothetical protein